MLLYIVRHADPIYETDSLTERGKLQAKAVAKRLRKAGIERIFSSPLGRAKETAEYTCKLLKLDKRIEEWTHEIHESRLEEDAAFIEKSGDAFLERLGYRKDGEGYRILQNNTERIAVFGHGLMITVWLAQLLGVPIETMRKSFIVTHTGITVIEFPDNPDGITRPRCLCFSDTSHLYAEKLELLHNNRLEI